MTPNALDYVDFCIPTYNRADYVRVLLDSLPSGATVHLRDNGSFLSGVDFNFKGRLHLEQDSSVVDMFENWSKVAQLGGGEWFFLTSDDDLYYANLQAELDSVLANSPNVGMIIFGHNIIDSEGRVLSTWTPSSLGLKQGKEAFDSFAYGVEARMPSILINRECYNQSGGLSTEFKISAADSELVQRLLVQYPVLFMPAVVSGYRVWPGAATHDKIVGEEWRLDVELWVRKLERVLIAQPWAKNLLWRRHVQHDIRLQNINAALTKLPGFAAKLRYLSTTSYPILSRPSSHLTCALLLIKSLVRKA